MSFQAMTWAIEQPVKTSAQKLVLLMMANHANGHTGQCNPSHSRLADECCMSVSSLKVQIKSLEEMGFLTIKRNSQDGVKLPNQYDLNIKATGSGLNLVGQNLPISNGAGLKGETPATPVKSDSQILAGGRSESGYKPVIKPKRMLLLNERENSGNFLNLTQEQVECKNWAATQNYWASCTQSDEEFLKAWAKPSGALRKQFDAHKKAVHLGGAARLNAENQNFGKSTRGNYATHYANNKKPTAADIAKSLRERANAADYANANAEILVRYD